ncbi:MAG: arylsulfatase [Verrucomicrobiota bacterium]
MKFFHVLIGLAFVCLSIAKGENPNVLVILVDDMGYGDMGAYNPESKIPTPHLDQLAADGMKFTDAHAPGPLCHLSRYGLMTGTFPFRTDVTVWPKKAVIEEDEDTIAKLLQRNGYQTAMVGKWHLGFNEEKGYKHPLPGGPVDQGFDTYFGIRASTDIPPYFYIRGDEAVMPPTEEIEARNTEGWTNIQGEFWRAGGISPDLDLHEVLPRFTEEAVEVISSHEGEAPLFLYLAYPAPHTPWLPTEEFVGKSEAGMYGDFMMMVDDEIGKVLAALDSKGIKEDTLVIFSSDNGPVWFGQDVEKFGHASSGLFRGMKADAWEGGHRMPFLVSWPAAIEAGSVSHRTISFTDVLATFAEMVGESLSENAGPDSFSFLPTLKGETQEPRTPIVLESAKKLMTIRQGDWKFIEGKGSGGFSERYGGDETAKESAPAQLYDLKKDPGEIKNLYAEEPEVVAELRAEMKRIIEEGRSR